MKYTFTTRVTFDAIDDIEARKKVVELKRKQIAEIEGVELKLQEVFWNKAPRGIVAEIDSEVYR